MVNYDNLGLEEAFQGTCFGHVVSKACQYAFKMTRCILTFIWSVNQTCSKLLQMYLIEEIKKKNIESETKHLFMWIYKIVHSHQDQVYDFAHFLLCHDFP